MAHTCEELRQEDDRAPCDRAKDASELKRPRYKMKRLKHKIRRITV